MSITSSLPTDIDGLSFVGPGGKLPAGTQVGSTDYAVTHVLLVAADGTTPLVTANGVYVQGPAAHDAAAAGNPLLLGGRASAAAPTDVSADGDVARLWVLRNGAQAAVLTAAGALIGGDAANGLDVDVTRLPALVAGTAIVGKVGIDQTAPGTTDSVSVATGQGAGATIGAVGDAAVTTNTTGTLSGKLRGIVALLVAIAAQLPASLGIKTAANSLSVTHASDDAVKTSVEIMDDWDESDRAKVNPIAGQAGVQGGSGTTNALTQRVVLATDVALPTGTNAIGKLAANSGVDIGDVDVTSLPYTAALTMTHTVGSATTSSSAMLAANANRKYALLQNIGSVDVYIKIAATAVASQGILLAANGGSFELGQAYGNLATGAINGITASGSASVLATEGV